MKELKGIVVAMVTPFKEDGSLNLEAEKKLVQYFIDKGVGGILVSGGTGEFTMMNVEERKQVIKTAVEVAKDTPVSIMAGITCNNTRDTVELAKFSGEVGADYVLVQPPHAIPVPTNPASSISRPSRPTPPAAWFCITSPQRPA